MAPRAGLSSLLHGRRGDRLVVLTAAAVGTAVLARRPAPLVDPPLCPGLFDLTFVVATRTWSDLPVSTLLTVLNISTIFVALGAATFLFVVAAGSRVIALAIGLALTASALLQPSLAVTPAASVAACALCWLAFSRAAGPQDAPVSTASRWSRSASLRPVLALAFAAAVTPPLAGPLAVISACIATRTRARALFALVPVLSGAAVGAALASGSASTGVVGCLWPHDAASAFRLLPQQITATLGMSPVALVLSTIGLWSLFPLSVETRARTIVVVAVVLLAALFADHAPGVLTPAALSAWTLCALGTREVVRALSRTTGARLGATALVVAVVILQVLHAAPGSLTSQTEDLGHARLSRGRFAGLVRAMPDGVTLVSEDAATALLARALPRDLRERRQLGALPAEGAAIAVRLIESRVYALPRAQSRIRHLGFQLAAVPEAPGLAEVRPGGECSAQLTGGWQAIAGAAGQRQVTVAAANGTSRGPIYLFAASDAPLDPQPLDWPDDAIRGFHPLGHDLTDPAHADRLTRDLSDYGVTLETFGALPVGPHLARVELWRTPGAPLRLTIGFASEVRQLVARLADVGSRDQFTICPSYGFTITPIG